MATRTCRICGRVSLVAPEQDGRCPRRRGYWRRHGVEWAPQVALRSCQTCAQPVQHLTRGRCHLCYAYWRRTGHERPPRLWARR
jgi:hypothetical protein